MNAKIVDDRRKELFTRNKNKGGTTIEITLIMPMVLLITFLAIELMLSVYDQAHVHGDLMLISAQEIKNTSVSDDGITIAEKFGDKRIFCKFSEMNVVKGYGIKKRMEQCVYLTNSSKKARGWQMLGDLLSDGGLAPVFHTKNESK